MTVIRHVVWCLVASSIVALTAGNNEPVPTPTGAQPPCAAATPDEECDICDCAEEVEDGPCPSVPADVPLHRRLRIVPCEKGAGERNYAEWLDWVTNIYNRVHEEEVDIGKFKHMDETTELEMMLLPLTAPLATRLPSPEELALEAKTLKANARVSQPSTTPRTVPNALSGRACAQLVAWIDTQFGDAKVEKLVELGADESSLRTWIETSRDQAFLALRHDLGDFQVDLTVTKLTKLIGRRATATLVEHFGMPVQRIVLRRVAFLDDEYIPLHADRANRTMQVLLSNEFSGGQLVYVHDDGDVFVPADGHNEMGTATIHDQGIVHGVGVTLSGVRHGLFLQG